MFVAASRKKNLKGGTMYDKHQTVFHPHTSVLVSTVSLLIGGT